MSGVPENKGLMSCVKEFECHCEGGGEAPAERERGAGVGGALDWGLFES